jgi:hypothetical protein
MSSIFSIISLHSRKGGVGKTTLALWIAQELAADGHVLLIDADVVGTEVADLFHDDRSGSWRLGLMDLLTQSTGGNADFESWLRQEIADAGSWKEMPVVKLGDAEIRVLPSSRSRSLEERERIRRELAHRFLVLDFAREQIHRRLLSLLRAVAHSADRPQAIVIDNSPFHVGLAELVTRLPAEAPVGMQEEHAAFWRQAHFYHLEVVGPDLQDVVSLSLEPTPDPAHAAHGWILNRDQHAPDLDAGHTLVPVYGCAPLAALAAARQSAMLRSPRVVHVGLNENLSRGYRGLYGDPDPTTGMYPEISRVENVLLSSWSALSRHRWDDTEADFVDVRSWRAFLDRLDRSAP